MDEQRKPSDLSRLDERAQHILATATRLILHYGYDKTTMNDIAAEANVSKRGKLALQAFLDHLMSGFK
jgi:AcrR family transcriptional regulator